MALKVGTVVKANKNCPWKHIQGYQGVLVAILDKKDIQASQTADDDKEYTNCVYYVVLGVHVKGLGIKASEYALEEQMLDVVKSADKDSPFRQMTKEQYEKEMRKKIGEMDPMAMFAKMMGER